MHQRHYFHEEYSFLLEKRKEIQNEMRTNKKQYFQIDRVGFPEKSHISALCPSMDEHGILRVGNRAKHANIPYDAAHPIIIENDTRLCYLIMNEAHILTGHGSVQITMQFIRQNYWINKLRSALRSYLHKCVTCARYYKQHETQLMSDLPIDRVNQNRAFLYTGVDYAGPIQIVQKYKGVAALKKCYIAIFVCMVTRAVHIDIVSDQSSMAFIMCFERFVARRGHCNKLFSDNGTNFRGAYKELKDAYRIWNSQNVQDEIEKRDTEWKFMKPSASHQGGIYEAAVKSTKFHLRRMVGKVHYTFEHLYTFLTKVEAILNSRSH